MKRRLVRLMLIGITAIALTGCSNLNEVIPPSNDELIEENEDAEDTDKEDSDNEDDNTVSSEGVARGNDSYVLARFPMAESFYVYDSETDSLRGINRYEMAEKTPNANPDIYRLYNEYDYYRSSLIGEGDGFLFFQDSVAFEEGGNSQSIVYAVKEDDYKIYDVWRNNGDGFIQGCEFYNGYIYIDYNIGYDENYTSLGEDVVCFKYDRITDSFTEGEVGEKLKKIIRAAGDIGAHIRRSGNFCNAHVFDECGYLPAVKDGELILIDSDGVTKNIPGLEEGYNAYYDESNIFTILVDYETGTGTVCVYDIKRDELKEITGDYTADRLLGKNGTKYYYSRTDSPEYGIKHNYIYEYDSESGNNRLLYDVKFAPGSDIFPGVEGFTLTDSFIYYVGFDNGSIFWVPVKIDDPSKEYPRIDLGSEELFNYGTIEYLSNTYECPDCNTDLVCTYVEYPVLNEYPSYNIDKINEYMKGVAQSFIDEDHDEMSINNSCEEHSEHPSWYRITDDYYVSAINRICDNYLTIDMSGYWYGGGAHGMPSRLQYMFDLTTGELKTLSDFYAGSEDDFKALVAEKTKEHFLSCIEKDDYGTPYFADDAETVYAQAYENVSLASGTIEFTDEGIIYYYPPYEMGPFASGFIDIKISYDELLGRNSL